MDKIKSFPWLEAFCWAMSIFALLGSASEYGGSLEAAVICGSFCLAAVGVRAIRKFAPK